LHLGTDRPTRAGARVIDVVEGLRRWVDRLAFDFEDFAEATANRDIPALRTVGAPIRRDHRRARKVPAIRHVVIDEGPQQGLVHVGAPLGAGQREQLAGKKAITHGFGMTNPTAPGPMLNLPDPMTW